MNILYYNLQLGCFDGSNSHAAGMLAALRALHGDANVVVANHFEEQTYNHSSASAKASLGRALDSPRMIRKRAYSKSAAREIVERVRFSGFAPDVVLARSTLYDSTPIEIARSLGCPLVTESNTPLEYECCDLRKVSIRPLVRGFERTLYDTSTGIYAVSSTLKRMLVDGCSLPDDMVKVVPNGYSADLYSDYSDRAGLRARVRSNEAVDDAFVIVFVGSLQIWHGIKRLTEIADRVNALGGRRTVFWVLGDGAERDLVERHSRSCDYFRWFGNVPASRMKELLYAADLGLMPYERVKSFYFSPLKMYDMVGAGLPYVGLRIGQIAEESPEEIRSSCLLDTTDPAAYAERIVELRDGDELDAIRDILDGFRAGCSWDKRAADLSEWLGGRCG